MLKRLKKSLSLTLVLALCMSFIACGSDGKSDDNFSDDSDSFEGRVKDSEQIAAQDNPNEGLGGGLNEDAVNDFSEFEGIWLGEANNEYDSMEDGQLYSAAYGYFNYGEGMENLLYEDGSRLTEDDESDSSRDEVPEWNGRLSGESDIYWSWDSELCQRNVSEFKGIWYYDGDLSAEIYIVIDSNGNWSYYQRAPGAEPAEMDYGTFSYSTDEVSTYYANSTLYDSVSYRVFEIDENSLAWGDEGVYYKME